MISIIDYGAGNLGSVYKALRYIGAGVNVTNDPAVVQRADALVLPGVGAFTHCMMGLESVHLADSTRAFIETGRPFLGICVGLQMLFDSSEEMGNSPGLGVIRGKVVRFDFDDGRWTMDDGMRPLDDGRWTHTGKLMDDGGAHTASSSHLESKFQNSELARGSRSTHHEILSDRPSSISLPVWVHRLKIPHIGWNTLDFLPDAALFRGVDQGERVYFVHSYYPKPNDPSIVSATSDYGGSFCCAVERGNVHATQFHPEKSGAVGLRILRNFVRLAA